MSASENIFKSLRLAVRFAKQAYFHLAEAYELSKEKDDAEQRKLRYMKMMQESSNEALQNNAPEPWKAEEKK